MRNDPRDEVLDLYPLLGASRAGWSGVWEGPLSGGCSENSLVSSLGWVIVTVPSVLCARCSPRKLVASRSNVTS